MDKKLILLFIVFFLAFGLNISLVVFEKPINKWIKASETSVPSSKNSDVFANPLTVTPDGNSFATISVFVKDQSNIAMEGKNVTLQNDFGNLLNQDVLTDKFGKAEFKITSPEEGIATIKVIIDGNIPISKQITIQFKN